MEIRIGQGIDVHQFAEGRRCVLGGVEVPAKRGLLGHSDADVLLHALIDAILGAVGRGDIGTVFPDTDAEWKDADSLVLLKTVWKTVSEEGWKLGNCDLTVLAQAPKLAPYVQAMRQNIADALGSSQSQVAIKATTTEHLGFVGREEGIMAFAVVLLTRSK